MQQDLDINTTTTDTAAELRAAWSAIHAPSTPTLEGATNFLRHFDRLSVITTLSAIVRTETSTMTGDVAGPLTRLRVQAALLRESERVPEK